MFLPVRLIPQSYTISSPSAEPSQWLYLITAGILVVLGGAFAGLTIALMGQDEVYLQVLAASGDGNEPHHARKVLNLLKKGKHWVLVTLLLGNVITNETLPIMLDRSLGGGWQAVLGSTVLIVIFGEVVPQSVCVRFGLPIGAFMAPFVVVLMWLLAPIAWPTAKLLDYLLGQDHGTTYKKAGLKTLVTLHRTLGTAPEERLNRDEVTIISAVLDLKGKRVGDIMTPIDDVFTLSADTVLNEETMNTILSEGYSRIPIYAVNDPTNFIGMLLVKMLITYDPEDCFRVDDFQLATLPETKPETSCLDIVNFFQEGKSHMVLVSKFPGEAYGSIGVLTLEDVIEELIGEEIVDESDVFVDVHKSIRRMHQVPYYRIPKNQKQRSPPTPCTERTDTPALTPRARLPKLVRKLSGGATESVSLEGDESDYRTHLMHLGPSNQASKPRVTKINTVKIKPGIPQQHQRKYSLQRAATDMPAPTSNPDEYPPSIRALKVQKEALETTGLLSAGHTASDAVQAVGYGSISSGPSSTQKHQPLQSRPSSSLALALATPPPAKSAQFPLSPPRVVIESVPAKLIFTPQTSQVDLLEDEESTGPSEASSAITVLTYTSQQSTSQPTGAQTTAAARSGNIVERAADIDGVRKVVLEVQNQPSPSKSLDALIDNSNDHS